MSKLGLRACNIRHAQGDSRPLEPSGTDYRPHPGAALPRAGGGSIGPLLQVGPVPLTCASPEDAVSGPAVTVRLRARRARITAWRLPFLARRWRLASLLRNA